VLLDLIPVTNSGFLSGDVKFSSSLEKLKKTAATFSVLCCPFLSSVKSTAPSGFEPSVCSIFGWFSRFFDYLLSFWNFELV
jgi:hypothetical protein